MEHIIALYIPSAQSRGDHLIYTLRVYQVMNLILHHQLHCSNFLLFRNIYPCYYMLFHFSVVEHPVKWKEGDLFHFISSHDLFIPPEIYFCPSPNSPPPTPRIFSTLATYFSMFNLYRSLNNVML